jgi:hypothetical protein
MGAFDQQLADGESQLLDQPWYNELVTTLKNLTHAGGISVEASTDRVVVHHADDGLVPGEVALNDVTSWGRPAADRISLDWTLTNGPGRLETADGTSTGSAITTAAGSAIVWTWPGSAWDATVNGNKLPAEVTVQVEATDTEEGVTVSSTDVSIIVGRSYDPSTHPGVAPHVEPTRDVAYLSGDGTATIDFDEYTDFGQASSLYRQVSAHLKNGDGSNVSVSGAYVDGEDLAGKSDLSFTATAQAPGVLVVTIEYEDENGDITTTRRAVRVRPSLDLQEEASTDPTLPPVSVTKGKGETTVAVGTPVSPANVAESAPVFEDGGPVWAEGRAEALARRLGVEDLDTDDPQLSLLQQAGSLLVSALAHPTEAGLMEYTLDLPVEANPGHVLIFDGGVLRLEEQSGGGWTAIGHLEDGTDTSSAHLTGNGALFTVEAELAYGQSSKSEFPETTVTRYNHVRPEETSATIRLPHAVPKEAGDRWHFRYRLQSEWSGGQSVSGSWSSWQEAEKVPDSPTSVELNDDGMLSVSGPGSPRGLVQWGPSGNNPIEDANVPSAEPLPDRLPAQAPTDYWNGPNDPPHLFVKLLQTAPSGSSRSSVERFDLTYSPDETAAVPNAPVPGNAIPQDWNVVPGMMLFGDTQTWIGSPNGYVSLGTGGSLVDKIELYYNENSYEVQKNSPTEFTHPVPFFNIDQLEVRLYTAGPVDAANLFDNDYSLFRQQSTTPVFDEQGGYFKQTLVAPPSAHGLEDRLLYQVSAGTDEQLVELTLENSSISQNDGPDVLTLDALLPNAPEISQSIDRSSATEVWSLTLEDDVDWQSAYLTLTAEALNDGKILSVTDESSNSIGTDNIAFNVQSDTTPQRIFIELNDSAFTGSDTITVSLELSGNGSTSNVDLELIPYS